MRDDEHLPVPMYYDQPGEAWRNHKIRLDRAKSEIMRFERILELDPNADIKHDLKYWKGELIIRLAELHLARLV